MVCLKFLFNFNFVVAGLKTETFSGFPCLENEVFGSILTTNGFDRFSASLKKKTN